MFDKNVITLKATCNQEEGTTTFNLGAIDAELVSGLHDLNPLQIMAMAAVQDGALLKLDAVTGANLKQIIGSETYACGHAIKDDAWFGILPTLKLSVGPFERKSQAMNAIVLALLGFSPTQAGEEDNVVEMHIGEPLDVPVPSIKLSAVEKSYLRNLTPEQFEKKLSRLKDEMVGPFGDLAKAIDPKLGEVFEKHAEETIQAIRNAVFSAGPSEKVH